MKQTVKLLIMVVGLFLLSACLYPNNQLVKNKIPYKNQIQSVQTAVNQFKQENQGIIPIKTRDETTPIYLKYPIDFNKLAPRYIAEPPGNAFEAGGIFQYVLVNVEENPTVKLIDLRTTEVVRELTLRIRVYQQKHNYPPFKEVIANDVFSLDYKKLNYKEPPVVISPYSNKNLPLIINGKGDIFVDYRADLYDALKKFDHHLKTGDDIRSLLVSNYDFVPAYSVPYTVKDGEPVFSEVKK